MIVEFTIPGPPRGKGRPRFRTAGKYVKTYTPEQTATYENLVRVTYQTQCRGKALDGPILAEITGYFPIPASVSKKKHAEMASGKIKHTKKCDCDNLAKIILDALNQIAYKDDAQVSDLIVRKRYSETPRVTVRLYEIQE